MNEEIELHDSTLSAIVYKKDVVAIFLHPAYIHRSPGRPGVDAGSGWHQNATIIIGDVTPFTVPAYLPQTISEGGLEIGNTHHDNTLPTSGTFQESIELCITFTSGETVIIRGKFLNIELTGEPVFVEKFTP